MSRTTYVIRDGELVERHLAGPLHEGANAPNVISDNMDPTFNHADGRRYDSKRAFEKAVRATGNEIIGNDTSIMRLRPPVNEVGGHDVKRAIEQIRSTGFRKDQHG